MERKQVLLYSDICKAYIVWWNPFKVLDLYFGMTLTDIHRQNDTISLLICNEIPLINLPILNGMMIYFLLLLIYFREEIFLMPLPLQTNIQSVMPVGCCITWPVPSSIFIAWTLFIGISNQRIYWWVELSACNWDFH